MFILIIPPNAPTELLKSHYDHDRRVTQQLADE